MAAIALLDNRTINQIAAGEVIERPLSVVKELVENSVDSGASSVTVDIQDGGVSQIRVTDNGAGIPAGQVRAAFLRHATSKLKTIADLMEIGTLGFRGEALASIASVSMVEMITKTYGDISGVRIEIKGGEVISEREIGAADGTTVIVRNLFYNVPARLAFLRKPAAEAGLISDLVNRLAIGGPETAFRFIKNGETVLQTNGSGKLLNAAFYVYGRELAERLLPVFHKEGSLTVEGFVGKPETARANRSYQSFYINGRYVKSDLIQTALEEASRTFVMSGRFPAAIIRVATDPADVDVNVHPTKLEVRFKREDEVFSAVREAVSAALEEFCLIPSTGANTNAAPVKGYAVPAAREEASRSPDVGPSPPSPVFREEPAVRAKPLPKRAAAPKPSVILPPEEPEQIEFTELKRDVISGEFKILGQAFKKIWVIEYFGKGGKDSPESSLFFIDQHAAHERILYEELLESAGKGAAVSQGLLRPVLVNMTLREHQLLIDNMDLFNEFGFEISDYGNRTAGITALPFIIKGPVKPDFFTEILDNLERARGKNEDVNVLKRKTIASSACRAAVKANDILGAAEAESLIKKLLSMENPFTCPHGRPVIIKITEGEWDRKFKRK